MLQFKVLGGLDTIGGNIVHIESQETRIITDFGLMMGEKEFEIDEVKPDDKRLAIFISHLHLDHMYALQYLTAPIDVYMTEESHRLLKTLIDLGLEPDLNVNLRTIPFKESLTIGDITITALPNDHDILGSATYIFESDSDRIIHSGDLRLNGLHSSELKNHLSQMDSVDVLFIEGTSFSFDDEQSDDESQLIEDFKEYLKRDEVLVINPYIRNISRLSSLNDAAEEAGRRLVWEKNFYKVLTTFYPDQDFYYLSDSKNDKYSVTLDEIRENSEVYVLQNTIENIDKLGIFEGGIYLHSNGEPLGDFDPHYQDMLDDLRKYDFQIETLSASGHAKREDLLEVVELVDANYTIPWHSFGRKDFASAIESNGHKVLLAEYGKVYTLEEGTIYDGTDNI